MNIAAIILVIIIIVAIIYFAVNYYMINYQYEKVIGSHIENAYEVNTPERMIEQINLAKEGMISEGLTEEDYGAWIFKKPDNSMKFQYEFIDSVIDRAKAVEIWRDSTYGGNVTSTETMGDVYEQKMDNLREFLKENGRADWIAKDAWYVKNHLFYYIFPSIAAILVLFILIILMAIAFWPKW